MKTYANFVACINTCRKQKKKKCWIGNLCDLTRGVQQTNDTMWLMWFPCLKIHYLWEILKGAINDNFTK